MNNFYLKGYDMNNQNNDYIDLAFNPTYIVEMDITPELLSSIEGNISELNRIAISEQQKQIVIQSQKTLDLLKSQLIKDIEFKSLKW